MAPKPLKYRWAGKRVLLGLSGEYLNPNDEIEVTRTKVYGEKAVRIINHTTPFKTSPSAVTGLPTVVLEVGWWKSLHEYARQV